MSVLVWLSLPGMASILIPSAGTAQSWITSVDERMKRVWVSMGRTTRASTSSSRGCPSAISLSGIMYESNETPTSSAWARREVVREERLLYKGDEERGERASEEESAVEDRGGGSGGRELPVEEYMNDGECEGDGSEEAG
jgi:hypothetical protein